MKREVDTVLIVIHSSLESEEQLSNKSLILRQLLGDWFLILKVVIGDEESEEHRRLDHGVNLLVHGDLIEMVDQVVQPLVDVLIPYKPPGVWLIHTVLRIVFRE